MNGPSRPLYRDAALGNPLRQLDGRVLGIVADSIYGGAHALRRTKMSSKSTSETMLQRYLSSLKDDELIKIMALGNRSLVSFRIGKGSGDDVWAFEEESTFENSVYTVLDETSSKINYQKSDPSTFTKRSRAVLKELVGDDRDKAIVEIYQNLKDACWKLKGYDILEYSEKSKESITDADVENLPSAVKLLTEEEYIQTEGEWSRQEERALEPEVGPLRDFREDSVKVNSKQLARHLLNNFMGWVYPTDAPLPETVYAATFAMDPASKPAKHAAHVLPHTVIAEHLRGMIEKKKVVDVRRTAEVGAWHVLHRDESGGAGSRLLVPVGLRVKVNESGRATLCKVSGYAAKTAECLRHEAELIRRLCDRAARHGVRDLEFLKSVKDIEVRAKRTLTGADAALASAFRDMAIIHSIFSDGGRRFKDQTAGKLASEKLERTINSIAAALKV